MPYPLDDNGNIRVDFVWGNFPLQPDEQRTDENADWNNEHNQPQDRGWGARSYGVTSDTLDTTETQNLSIGDHDGYNDSWDDVSTRSVSVPTIHNIATTGYSNYPAFIPNYAGDGDITFEAVVPDLTAFAVSAMDDAVVAAGLVYASTTTHLGATTSNDGKLKSQSPLAGVKANVGSTVTATFFNAPEVPNVVGLTESAANTALIAANVVKGAVTTANNAAGATAENDGLVKTQTPAAGTTVNTGASVALVKYAYTATTTGPVFAVVYDAALTAGDYKMYLLGQTIKPTVGWSINLSGNDITAYNGNWEVISVENDNAYNTGGTKVIIRNITITATALGTSGTWTKNV